MIVDSAHWAELPDGHTRSTILDTADSPDPEPAVAQQIPGQPASPSMPSSMPSSVMFDQSRAALEVTVARRPLIDYDRLAGLPPDVTTPGEAGNSSGESLVGAA